MATEWLLQIGSLALSALAVGWLPARLARAFDERQRARRARRYQAIGWRWRSSGRRHW